MVLFPYGVGRFQAPSMPKGAGWGRIDRNGQRHEAQWLKDLLESAELRRALGPQGPGQHPQIQHQVPAGPHRGGEGMDDHQQRGDREGARRSVRGVDQRGRAPVQMRTPVLSLFQGIDAHRMLLMPAVSF